MVDATLGTILQTEGQRRQWQNAPEVGPTPRNPDTEYPKFSSLGKLLNGSKRDVCAVRNFAEVLGVAHEALVHLHALRPAVGPVHRGKPPAVDRSLHNVHLAPSTRHDPHSCAHAQLSGDSPRQFPSFQASAPAPWALRFPGIQSRLCKQAYRAGIFLRQSQADKRRNAS
jgi:hypothetical protein